MGASIAWHRNVREELQDTPAAWCYSCCCTLSLLIYLQTSLTLPLSLIWSVYKRVNPATAELYHAVLARIHYSTTSIPGTAVQHHTSLPIYSSTVVLHSTIQYTITTVGTSEGKLDYKMEMTASAMTYQMSQALTTKKSHIVRQGRGTASHDKGAAWSVRMGSKGVTLSAIRRENLKKKWGSQNRPLLGGAMTHLVCRAPTTETKKSYVPYDKGAVLTYPSCLAPIL